MSCDGGQAKVYIRVRFQVHLWVSGPHWSLVWYVMSHRDMFPALKGRPICSVPELRQAAIDLVSLIIYAPYWATRSLAQPWVKPTAPWGVGKKKGVKTASLGIHVPQCRLCVCVCWCVLRSETHLTLDYPGNNSKGACFIKTLGKSCV